MTYTKTLASQIRVGDYIRRDNPGYPPPTREGRVTRIETQPHYYDGTTVMAYHFYVERFRTGIFGRRLRSLDVCLSHNWESTEVEVVAHD